MVGCDSHTRWLGRILTDAILLNGVGDCDGYVRRKVGAYIKKNKKKNKNIIKNIDVVGIKVFGEGHIPKKWTLLNCRQL